MSDLSSIIRWLSFVTIIVPQRKFYSDRKCHLRNILGLIDGTSLFKLKELSLHAQLRYYALHILSYWLNSIMEILMFRVQLKHIIYVVWGVHNGDLDQIYYVVRPSWCIVCVCGQHCRAHRTWKAPELYQQQQQNIYVQVNQVLSVALDSRDRIKGPMTKGIQNGPYFLINN